MITTSITLEPWLYIIILYIVTTFPSGSTLVVVPAIRRRTMKLEKLPLKASNHHDSASRIATSSRKNNKFLISLPRVYFGPEVGPLYEGARVPLTADQAHYLTKVHRIRPKQQQQDSEEDLEKQPSLGVRLFNEENGEWLGRLIQCSDNKTNNRASRKLSVASTEIFVECVEQIRSKEQCVTTSSAASCWVMFGPIRKERMKILIEKCTELGVRGFIPVRTSRTDSVNVDRLDVKKMRLQVIEASEQCERLSIPRLVMNPIIQVLNNDNNQEIASLNDVLFHWEKLKLFNNNSTSWNTAVLLVCRERESGEQTRPIMETVSEFSHLNQEVVFLIGPEGGWSPEEESLFDNKKTYPFLKSVSLIQGLVLRSETAAIIAAGTFLSSTS
jgi:16S rRNA (uracil1498-N3)-methyltransferase